jgi:hypothetical protein
VDPSGARGRGRLDVAPHRHSDRPTSCGGDGRGRRRERKEAAEEEAEEEEEKSCCWAGSEPMWPPLLLLFAEREGRSLSLSCERRPVEVPPPPHALAHEYPPAPPTAAPSTLRAHLHPVAPPCMRKPHAPPTHHRSRRTSA